ncbi:MAG: serine/threonine-protein kinase [Minicystis sp.]
MPDTHEEPRVFQPGGPFRHYHYVVESFLGAGASGQVYAVRHRFTGDRFALKVGHLKDRGHAKKVARSLAEAKATYGLRHPNVVRVFDLACEDDGMVWQLMELLEGRSVGELIGRGGRLSPLYAIDIALEVAWGLQAAHEQQIIHRDVQPSNVFVTAAGQVKVLDFSLAKVIPSGLRTTRRDGAMGTSAFMSPEHLKGAPPTPQFDVYALGLMLWQMLVGRHPFESSLMDMMTLVRRQLEEDPASLVTAAGLPAYCDEVIRGATAKDPARRYDGMWTLGRALLDLRARLLADPAAAAVVQDQPLWERRYPIVRNPEGHQQYRPPRSLPAGAPAPPVPAARVMVPAGVEPAAAGRQVVVPVSVSPAPVGKHVVAVTVPMAAVAGPAPPVSRVTVESAVDVAAPTLRARPPSRRRVWALVMAIPMLLAAGAGVWLLVEGASGPAPGAQKVPAARPKR